MHPPSESLESRRLLATKGLSAAYFDGLDFAGTAVNRVDLNIKFNFEHNRPAPGIRGNTYSGRWTGLVKASASELFRIAGSKVRDNSDSGALLIQSNDQMTTFQYELRSGKVIDTFTMARTRVRS